MRGFAEARNHDDVLADALYPPMEGNDAIAIVDMENIDLPTPERRQPPKQGN
jgi:hypothetical protein